MEQKMKKRVEERGEEKRREENRLKGSYPFLHEPHWFLTKLSNSGVLLSQTLHLLHQAST
jgi:hypothetical protein